MFLLDPQDGCARLLDVDGHVDGVALSADASRIAILVDDDIVLAPTADASRGTRAALPRAALDMAVGAAGGAVLLLGDDRGTLLARVDGATVEPVDTVAFGDLDPEQVIASPSLHRVLVIGSDGEHRRAHAIDWEKPNPRSLDPQPIQDAVGDVVLLRGQGFGVAASENLSVVSWPDGNTTATHDWADLETMTASPDGAFVAWWWHTWDGTDGGVGLRVGRPTDGVVVIDTTVEVPRGQGGELSSIAVDEAGVVRAAWGQLPNSVTLLEIGPDGQRVLLEAALPSREA